MYENAELEYLLRKKCSDYPEDIPYRELVKNYFINELKLNYNLKRRDIKSYKYLNNIKENWLMLIDRRNALAHVIEDHEPEKGYFIQSNNENCLETFTIYERNLDKERCDLLEVVAMIKEILVQKPAYYTTNPLSSNRSDKYNIATFFSDNVGIELGFEQTNEFRVVYANGFDKFARQTYQPIYSDIS